MGLPFVPLERRARWAIVFLAATMLVDVVAIGANLRQISAINGFLDGTRLDFNALTSGDHLKSVVEVVKFIVLLASGITFIRWFHAAYRNVTLLAPVDVTYRPGWAIGAWFVPILGLWRPKQIADEIWHASELQPPPARPPADRLGKTTTVLALWWAFWIISSIVGNVSTRFFFGTDTLAHIRQTDELHIAALLLDIVAAAFAILVVKRITSRLAGTTAPPPTRIDVPAGAGLPPMP
jgi:Domain of unknown function (DUF4328)